jgi:hypothetical protein
MAPRMVHTGRRAAWAAGEVYPDAGLRVRTRDWYFPTRADAEAAQDTETTRAS